MERTPEPELMDDPEQARAYAEADFEAPHSAFIERFATCFPDEPVTGCVLDLGCGPGDITRRFARAYPACEVHGVDGARAMLALGREANRRAGLDARIAMIEGRLPDVELPRARYDAIISNSLLHHLHEPMVLWEVVRRRATAGAPVFVMDLMRPADAREAERLVEVHAAGEPEVLRRDFHHSLHAAFRPDEVRAQLARTGLEALRVEPVSDRHLLVHGRAP